MTAPLQVGVIGTGFDARVVTPAFAATHGLVCRRVLDALLAE